MNKESIYNLLNKKNIKYELSEHKAVYNMKELSNIEVLYPESEAKNLFVRDDKKRKYYLITMKGDKKVNLKEFRSTYNTRPLSFASSEDLKSILGLEPGSVTPFGLLNDNEVKVEFFLDQEFNHKLIGVHANDNTVTIWLNTDDLIEIIKNHGNLVNLIEIE